MERSMLLEVIGDSIVNRVIDLLIEGNGMDYSKKDIADNCGISRPTVYKVLPELVRKGIVRLTRKIGRVQLYSINKDSEKVKALLKLEELLLRQSFEGSKEKLKIRV
ncbi:MAG: winged helix-turn-helix domain-containing protein [Candidatus Micrarchaeota archaeon]